MPTTIDTEQLDKAVGVNGFWQIERSPVIFENREYEVTLFVGCNEEDPVYKGRDTVLDKAIETALMKAGGL